MVTDQIGSDHGVAEVCDPLQGHPDITIQAGTQVDRAAGAIRVQRVFVRKPLGGFCQLQGDEWGVMG